MNHRYDYECLCNDCTGRELAVSTVPAGTQDKLLSILLLGEEIPDWDKVSSSRFLEGLIERAINNTAKKAAIKLEMAKRATPITREQLEAIPGRAVVKRKRVS
jgi:hypothetical protein